MSSCTLNPPRSRLAYEPDTTIPDRTGSVPSRGETPDHPSGASISARIKTRVAIQPQTSTVTTTASTQAPPAPPKDVTTADILRIAEAPEKPQEAPPGAPATTPAETSEKAASAAPEGVAMKDRGLVTMAGHKAPTAPPPKHHKYKGPTYTPSRPDDTIEVPGVNVLYASKPGTTYSNSAPKKIAGVVFHHTSSNGAAEGQVAYGQRVDPQRGFQAGYHFYVDRDGTVIQGAPLSARTNHVKTPGHGRRKDADRFHSNSNSIGVSLLGDGRNPTAAQLDAAEKLGRALVNRYGIDPRRVVGHGELQTDREAKEGFELAQRIRASQVAAK